MERKRNRKVKRATIEAAAEKLLDRAGINGGESGENQSQQKGGQR
jgi:phoH family protein